MRGIPLAIIATLIAFIIVGSMMVIARGADLPVPRKPVARAVLKREPGPAPKYVAPVEAVSRPAGTP